MATPLCEVRVCERKGIQKQGSNRKKKSAGGEFVKGGHRGEDSTIALIELSDCGAVQWQNNTYNL